MAAITTTQTFIDGEQLTSEKLNNILANSTVDADAITGSSLAVTGGRLKLNQVTSAEMQTDSVATAAIQNTSVTASKLSGGQTGSAPVYGIRAWGTFEGAAASPITPTGAGNISTITTTSSGIFTITFDTAMPSTNYAAVFYGYMSVSAQGAGLGVRISSKTVNSFVVNFYYDGGGTEVLYDPPTVDFIVVG
jgi:hypothetical protein